MLGLWRSGAPLAPASCWRTLPRTSSTTPNTHTLSTEALSPGAVPKEAGPGPGWREAGMPGPGWALGSHRPHRSTYHGAAGPRTAEPSSSGVFNCVSHSCLQSGHALAKSLSVLRPHHVTSAEDPRHWVESASLIQVPILKSYRKKSCSHIAERSASPRPPSWCRAEG